MIRPQCLGPDPVVTHLAVRVCRFGGCALGILLELEIVEAAANFLSMSMDACAVLTFLLGRLCRDGLCRGLGALGFGWREVQVWRVVFFDQCTDVMLCNKRMAL